MSIVGVENRAYEVEVTQHMLVSEAIDQLCLLTSLPTLAAYRLTVMFEDQEVLLRPNEVLLPILQYNSVRTEKNHSKNTFFTFKSLGRLLQLS